ncbi:hypothetical protein NKH77_27570 [Streptomyces sp. M19]
MTSARPRPPVCPARGHLARTASPRRVMAPWRAGVPRCGQAVRAVNGPSPGRHRPGAGGALGPVGGPSTRSGAALGPVARRRGRCPVTGTAIGTATGR